MRATAIRRSSIYWADMGDPAGRRPVVVLSRDAAAAVLNTVTVAPVTRTIRGIRSEAPLGPTNGLPADCVVTCDHIMTIPIERLDDEPVGSLTLDDRIALDRALRFSLDILS